MTVPEASVAVELERLRGTVSTGFAEVKGSLAVLVEQSARNQQDVKQLRADMEKSLAEMRTAHDRDVDELRADVEPMKRARWPLQSVGVLISLGALALTLYQGLGH
ncbi:hypothetical protein [Streptomyces sp. SID8352]|uniref:hypothetical protein n=1 Tax=Streptomyces sp. SID8352 TaxID=2690338 RepID=UPI00136E21E7|nr:hypothetical protein [Streptomyces sp. SID8352]MYU21276.1 hypothetical protein [Streptomyces sp. SID8352]